MGGDDVAQATWLATFVGYLFSLGTNYPNFTAYSCMVQIWLYRFVCSSLRKCAQRNIKSNLLTMINFRSEHQSESCNTCGEIGTSLKKCSKCKRVCQLGTCSNWNAQHNILNLYNMYRLSTVAWTVKSQLGLWVTTRNCAKNGQSHLPLKLQYSHEARTSTHSTMYLS